MSHSQIATRASLICRLKDADDVHAWREFFEIYSPVIYRVAIKRGLQSADAENLIQEVFLAVSKYIGKWLDREDRGPFRAWLLRIARNETIDMVTKRATRPLGRDGSEAEKIFESLAVQSEISKALDIEFQRHVFRWASQKVQDAVAPKTWAAFQLTSIAGLSVQQAAEKLNTRRGNIYFARSRVMSRIRKIIEKFEGQDENS